MFAIASVGCREKEQTPSTVSKPVLVERTEDLRTIITTGLAAGNPRIVIPPGRYRVQAERGSHLTFSGLTDVEIVADGVELVCTSTVRAVLFDACTNVTLSGLAVDYDPLPFTQGAIVAMAPDKSWIEFEVARGYPANTLGGPFQIYDPAAGTLRRSDAAWKDEIQNLGANRYRITKTDRYRMDPAEDTERIGDIVIAKNASGKPGSPHAFELQGCRNVRLEGIRVFASPSFGFLERSCHATTYLRCKVDRRSPDDDPVNRATPRLRSLNADAFHSKDATKGPAILSCTARFMGDDAVNINGRYHFVRGGQGHEVRIATIDKWATIEPGDPVEFMPYSGPRPPDAKVLRRLPDPESFSTEEKNFIRKLRMDERMRMELLGGEVVFWKLMLDRDVSLATGSAVCCPLRLGHGFAVKDCDFGDNRSRGILIKASKGEVSANRITHSRMAAILVAPEFWWMEAGMSSDVVIRDNFIKGSLQTPIQIHARGGDRKILPAGAMRDISIVNNRFEDCSWPIIHVTSTSGLTIKDNFLPPAPSAVKQGRTTEPIVLEQCETR